MRKTLKTILIVYLSAVAIGLGFVAFCIATNRGLELATGMLILYFEAMPWPWLSTPFQVGRWHYGFELVVTCGILINTAILFLLSRIADKRRLARG